MAEEADAAEREAPEKAKKKGSSKLLLIVGLLVALVGSAGGAWFLGLVHLGANKTHEPLPEATAEAEKSSVATGQGPGALASLDPFIANLSDEGGNRYLKATFQLEFLGKSVPETFNSRAPQIRDTLLTLLSSKSFDEIRTPEGKQELREEIIKRVNQALDRDQVKAVYFTEFIVQ